MLEAKQRQAAGWPRHQRAPSTTVAAPGRLLVQSLCACNARWTGDHSRASAPERGRHPQQRRGPLRAAAAAALPAGGAVGAPEHLEKLLTSRAFTPAPYVGPVEVQLVPGKRLGLVATRNVALGEPLLVCCRPLAVLLGQQGRPPSNEELVEALTTAQLEPQQAAWLRLLSRGGGGGDEKGSSSEPAAAASGRQDTGAALEGDNGGNGSAGKQVSSSTSSSGEGEGGEQGGQAGGEPAVRPPAADVAALTDAVALLAGTWPRPAGGKASSSSTAGEENSSSGNGNGNGNGNGAVGPMLSVLGVPCPLSPAEVEQLVAQNAYAEASEDTCAAALKELTPESVAGVWPEFSLLNHSCAPNTCAAPFGAVLVVRAAAPILAGEELTTCYLGEARLAPIRERRAALRAAYGFHCQCARCLEEQRAFPTNWYPQDAALLGLEDTTQASAASGGSSSGGAQAVGLLFGLWEGLQVWFGFGAAAAARPAPSSDNFVLSELSTAAAPGGLLAAEVQAAAAAPGTRVARQRRAAVLARAASGRRRLEDAIDGLSRPLSGPAARRWLMASAFAWLRAEADALDLFLSAGALPSESDIRAAEAGAAGALRRRGGGLLTTLLFGAGGGRGGDNAALAPQEDEERAEAAARRALKARQLVALMAAAEALDGVARGSELHLQMAVAALDAARALHAAGSVEVQAAELACGRAHAARYGPLRPEVLRRAVEARRKMLLGASLSRRMSILAWDGGEM